MYHKHLLTKMIFQGTKSPKVRILFLRTNCAVLRQNEIEDWLSQLALWASPDRGGREWQQLFDCWDTKVDSGRIKEQRCCPKLCLLCTAFPEHKKNKTWKTLISLGKIGSASLFPPCLPKGKKKLSVLSKNGHIWLVQSLHGGEMNCHKKALKKSHVWA